MPFAPRSPLTPVGTRVSVIIKNVVASASEAEYAALFIVGQEAVAATHTLEDLGYPQEATLIICDNECAVGIANRTVKQVHRHEDALDP
jgi:hypothetical protein